MVLKSIGTASMSANFMPAFSSVSRMIISPEVPSGTPTLRPRSCCMVVMPGWAITRSLKVSRLTATILVRPLAGSQMAPGPIAPKSRLPAIMAWIWIGPLVNTLRSGASPSASHMRWSTAIAGRLAFW